ncbi:MAG: exodeoxyribonuclease VII small subunit [candidate division Zixibacteria bacterium]|nr:exodeoxyribonuclease VII small subunit [candidate division Zixibacteria bacterium]
MSARKKPKDFETAIDRLEEITGLLESGDVSLEKSIELYSEGIKMAGLCNEKLTEAEKTVRKVVQGIDSLEEMDFDQGEDT